MGEGGWGARNNEFEKLISAIVLTQVISEFPECVKLF